MLLFGTQKRQKHLEMQRLLTKVVNRNCQELAELREGPRGESRVFFTMPVVVVPLRSGEPDLSTAFATVTREVSTSGLSLVLSQPLGVEEAIVAFPVDRETKYLRTRLCHEEPFGAGLYQAGFSASELATEDDFPGLSKVRV